MKATNEGKVPQALCERIRQSRLSLGYGQEYVALRLGRTKGWMSKVESGKLGLDQVTLRNMGKVLHWSDDEIKNALALVPGGVPSGNRRRTQHLKDTIRARLAELQEVVGCEGMQDALYKALAEDLDPAPVFLEFAAHSLERAVQNATKR